MRNQLACLGMLALAVSGCALCADPHDCKYVAYGGVRQRTDMVRGRVGSIIDPAPEINRVVKKPMPPAPEEDDWEPPADEQTGPDIEDESTDESEDTEIDSGVGDLPELDGEGSIELPELDNGTPGGLPDLPNADELQRDDGDSLRSATKRNPLSDVFDEEF